MNTLASATDAIQRAGAAVHSAQSVLDAAAANQASLVKQALESNPFGLENDGLFNTWRSLAGIAQEVQALEERLRSLHATLSSLSSDNTMVVTEVAQLPAPQTAKVKTKLAKPKAVKPVLKKLGEKKASKEPTKSPRAASAVGTSGAPAGNDARVLSHLRTVLSSDDFAKVVQAQVADAVGIPKGSIGRSMTQLVLQGALLAGEKGTFKLAAR